jgi:negative regulator of sigma E activity
MAKNYFKQIDEYIDGELTGSELSDFIKELGRNPELSKEVELYKDVNKLLLEKVDNLRKRDDLDRMHEEYMRSRNGGNNR